MNRLLGTAVALLAVACSGQDDKTDAYVADVAIQHKRIFVTGAGYTGDLGGIAGGDARCANTAAAAGLGGTWKAWLSDSDTDAIDRISDIGPWHLLDGKVTFNNKANLATSPIVPIDVNENGDRLSVKTAVMTGTEIGGRSFATGGLTCKNWTSSDWTSYDHDDALLGNSGYNDSRWTHEGVNYCCYNYSLYCIEQ
jgi:hypothetical protein